MSYAEHASALSEHLQGDRPWNVLRHVREGAPLQTRADATAPELAQLDAQFVARLQRAGAKALAQLDFASDSLPQEYVLMVVVQSKITSQGQVSVPAEVRRKLGAGPGSVLEWREEGEHIVVRRAGRFTSQDIHDAVFKQGPKKARSLGELDAGIAEYLRRMHVRG